MRQLTAHDLKNIRGAGPGDPMGGLDVALLARQEVAASRGSGTAASAQQLASMVGVGTSQRTSATGYGRSGP